MIGRRYRSAQRSPWSVLRTRQQSLGNREGFALAAALLAIVLIGAIVTGLMFTTTEDTKVGATVVARGVAMQAAESAIAQTVSNLIVLAPDSIGVAASRSSRALGPTSMVVYITRLDSSTCWIVADAIPDAFHSGAKARIGVLARLQREPDGALTIASVSERWWSELF
jgi:Tfp pilus assembly protein PilX